MGQRIRVTDNQANLLKQLDDQDAKKLLQAIDLYKKYGNIPDPDEELPKLCTADSWPVGFNQPTSKPRPSYPAPFLSGDPSRVLVIPDLHAPFIREGALEWCLEQQKLWNCGKIVAIGDIVDQHAISYHESDPDGMSAGQEYKAAKKQLRKLFHMFPGTKDNPVYCCLGNHDLLIARKAKTAGLSSHFVRSLGEVYNAPGTWNFVDSVEIDDVVYQHGGAGGNAKRMAMHSRRSTVQGHLHSEFSTDWLVSERDAIFGCQVGALLDDKAYAFAYGRPYPKKSAIGCAVILNNGKTPVNLLMPLG